MNVEGDTVSKGRKSKSDDWTNGHEVEASAVGRPAQSSSITFDKDNPLGFALSGATAKDSELSGSEPDSNPTVTAQPMFGSN